MNELNTELENIKKQKYLKNVGLIVLLGLLSAFVPLSIDIYLPALPNMTEYFKVNEAMVNLTLIIFYIFFGLGTLFWGPLSDKYGRKYILVIGMVLYFFASLLCAASFNIYFLILARAFQAFGGSAAATTATAIVKDVYSGRRRETILALVQSMVVISPAIAPIFGAFLMKITSWQGIFITQSVIGIIGLLGAILFQESIKEKSKVSIIKVSVKLITVLNNKRFTSLLLIFSINGIAFMSFISSSSYIYQNEFKLSSQVYSYFFAANAFGMLLGPYIYIFLSRVLSRNSILKICYVMMITSGILVALFGIYNPFIFAFLLLPATISGSAVRPAGIYLMLEQQKNDIGSASSLIVFSSSIMGSIGISIASMGWAHLTVLVGVLNLIIGIVAGYSWLIVSKKSFLKVNNLI